MRVIKSPLSPFSSFSSLSSLSGSLSSLSSFFSSVLIYWPSESSLSCDLNSWKSYLGEEANTWKRVNNEPINLTPLLKKFKSTRGASNQSLNGSNVSSLQSLQPNYVSKEVISFNQSQNEYDMLKCLIQTLGKEHQLSSIVKTMFNLITRHRNIFTILLETPKNYQPKSGSKKSVQNFVVGQKI